MENNNAELISIVVPVYNAAPFLEKCVLSLVEQDYEPVEILLVNDGSTDGSKEICDRLAAQYPQIRVFHRENSGVSATRNFGIEHANGKYLMFADSDDWLEPSAAGKMIEAMEKYQVGLVLSGYSRFAEDDGSNISVHRLCKYSVAIMQSRMELSSLFLNAATSLFGVSIWAKLYRMDIIREHHVRFPEHINYEEDCCFNLAYYRHIDNAAALREYMYHYRQNVASLSKGYRAGAFKFLVNGFRERKKYLAEIGMEESIPRIERIFLTVIKINCQKITLSPMSAGEKRTAYQEMLAFPETVEIAESSPLSRNMLTRLITVAIRHRNVPMLASVMNLWKVKNKLKSMKNKLKFFVKKALGRSN